MSATGRSVAAAALVLTAALLAGAGAARAAGGCPDVWEAASGPLPGGIGPADFGAIPEACPGSELTLRLRTALLVASANPDFYGSVISGAMLRARHRVGASGWVSVAIDALDVRYVDNGGLAATAVSFGPPTVAAYRAFVSNSDTTAAVYARALLPLDPARKSGVETGFEIGAVARKRPGRRATFDAGVALTGPLDVVAGRAYGRLEPVALAEAWYAFRPAVALSAGFTAKVELAPTPTFVTAIPRVTGRFALLHRLWLAALVEVPIAGIDRTDLVASVFVGYSP